MKLVIKPCSKCGGKMSEKDNDGDITCLYCGKVEYAVKSNMEGGKMNFIIFKASCDALYGITAEGKVMRYDGENWEEIKPTGLFQRWLAVEIEWQQTLMEKPS